MKQLICSIAALAIGFCAWAQPLLVGHRGSSYGLENSEESFKNGVKLGYDYLETDVKMTKDGYFVCSHDDDTKRLGGTKTIAESTLEELKSETLSQTRGGVKYTGQICSVNEYLTICREAGIGAVVELKWTAGINNNDQTNIPKLITAIKGENMIDNVIILTSMKPCLEYIRKNYPEIKLQFLTGSAWKNHFDWCVEWGMDVDIQSGYFDKAAVDRFHSKNLKVNMWTTNTDDGYLLYGNMGCDYITTDNLDKKNLPALDPEALIRPNYSDFPVSDYTPDMKGKYELKFISEKNPDFLKDIQFEQAYGSDFSWKYWGPSFGQIENGEAVEVEDEDYEWASYARTTGYLLGLYEHKFYLVETGESFFAAPAAVEGAFAISGTERDFKLYAYGEGKLWCFSLDNGIYTGSLSGEAELPEGFKMYPSPTTRDNVIVIMPEGGLREYSFAPEFKLVAESPSHIGKVRAIDFMRYGPKVYAAIANDNVIQIYDASDGVATLTPASAALEAAEGSVGLNFRQGETRGGILSVFMPAKGMMTYEFDPFVEEVKPVDMNLTLERQWILSNTTGNRPDHIDGTNAQQGTAVDGKFYVNDCEDKLIYIFDNTGCIGLIPGGAGWGCARDDAGNIVVRDDKSSGNTHSFIIYPAGAMPDNYSEPIRLEIEVPVAGQTNFINASGNLLSADGGYIYLFPNKEAKVNIISIISGNIASVKSASGLNYAGSAAGYVVPINNDPENWIYQVRNNSIMQYSGGNNLDISTSRASTKAPDRNSTGGCAFIIEGGNKILLHNSGANYKGGFTIRDISLDKVICSVDPIGSLGYEEGGNYSTFNWLFVERAAERDYTVYQYCPANGMAVYRLYDKNSGVDEVGRGVDSWNIEGKNIAAIGYVISIVDITGRVVMVAEDSADLSSLRPGIYIATAPGMPAKKILVR